MAAGTTIAGATGLGSIHAADLDDDGNDDLMVSIRVYVGASINGRGFIPLKGRVESESPSR